MNTLQQKIESLLFYKNEPVSFSWLAKKLQIKEDQVKESIKNMSSFYSDRGITLVFSDDKVSLMTAEISSNIISSIAKDNEERELSKQALETLSIILYKGKIGKQELDYIRGVNSVFILRNLLIRGLVEKETNPDDKRSFLYSISHDTLAFLGLQHISDLPQFEEFSGRIHELENDWHIEKTDEKESLAEHHNDQE